MARRFHFCNENPDLFGFTYFKNDKYLFDQINLDLCEYEPTIIFEEGLRHSSNPLKWIDITLKKIHAEYKDFENMDLHDLWTIEGTPPPSDLLEDIDKYIMYTGYQTKIEGCNLGPRDLWEKYEFYLENIERSSPNINFIFEEEVTCLECAKRESFFFDLIFEGMLSAQLEGKLLVLKRKLENGSYLPEIVDEALGSPEEQTDKQIKKLAWLHELGIIEFIMDQCKEQEKVIPLRVAKVIHSFTGLGRDSIRKAVMAINDKNLLDPYHPFSQTENKEFAKGKRRSFRML